MGSLQSPTTRYSRAASDRLKPALLALLLALGAAARGQPASAPAADALQLELRELLAEGRIVAAVQRAQQAVRTHPDDVGVWREYVDLHLALAREWIAQRRFADAETALQAVLTLDKEQPEAFRLKKALDLAKSQATQQTGRVVKLLKLELFDPALDLIQESESLRPDGARELAAQKQSAWLGAADDHYLARDFSEAFALYEQVLAEGTPVAPDVRTRWALSLALALSDEDVGGVADPPFAGRLYARARDVLRPAPHPILDRIIGGLLAERAGHLTDAGQAYADALGQSWSLPPADRRATAVAQLREQVIRRARALYENTPLDRRSGFWAISLPNVWKERRTPHFTVSARNDLVAEHVALAAAYHLDGIRAWLGVAGGRWDPVCAVRVHPTQDDLHQATQTQGLTMAVSHVRREGAQVTRRELELVQTDPWLLSATLPHELTHLVLADLDGAGRWPLAIEEGLAVHAEPPARRLMYRRLLPAEAPVLPALLQATELPADVEDFYARSGALVAWLLNQSNAEDQARPPVRRLLDAFAQGVGDEWWRTFGFEDSAAAQDAWRSWYAEYRRPARMPLMIRVEPSDEQRSSPG